MPLRNIPERPTPLASLVTCRAGQVASRAFCSGDATDFMILACADGEGVSEEAYLGDTLYVLVEGRAAIVVAGEALELSCGDCVKVPAHTEHALEGRGAFKVLQMTVA